MFFSKIVEKNNVELETFEEERNNLDEEEVIGQNKIIEIVREKNKDNKESKTDTDINGK